jgi:putative copper export protein
VTVALTAAILVGTVLLLGSGVFARFVGPSDLAPDARRALAAGAAVGAVLVALGSLGDAVATLARVARTPPDLPFLLEYLHATGHGRASLARTGLVLVLGAWSATGPIGSRDPIARSTFAAAAASLLLTISWSSHSAAMSATGLLADVAHLLASVPWAGSLLFLAVLRVWDAPAALVGTVRRVGRLGIVSVAVLATTGTVMSVLHLYGVEALTRTSYGLALVAKLALVTLVLAVAALNRFVLVPRLERGADPAPLQRAVRFEAVLLTAVLVATAVLTTREPAHAAPGHDGHAAAACQARGSGTSATRSMCVVPVSSPRVASRL